MGDSLVRWFCGASVALMCLAVLGCAHLQPSRCADADTYLEFAARLRAAPSATERERIVDDADARMTRDTTFDRRLLHVIADAQTGDVAAARAALETLPASSHSACPATSELIALYSAYLDRLTLLAQLADANRKIKALTDIERTMMKHDSNTKDSGPR